LKIIKNAAWCAVIFFISCVVSAAPKQSKTTNLDKYFIYLKQYPEALGPFGKAANGEIEIVLDRTKIATIEKNTGRTVGVIAEDYYWLWLNDPVKFPNNKYGVYGRFLWKSSLTGGAGVAVMPVLPNRNIVLIRTYRHATRSWEYELPRGSRELNETIEDAAKREVKEETGMIIEKLTILGEMAVDSGIANTVLPICMANVIAEQNTEHDASEAIDRIDNFSVAELHQGFKNGYLVANTDNKLQRVYLRDPFLAYALLMLNLNK